MTRYTQFTLALIIDFVSSGVVLHQFTSANSTQNNRLAARQLLYDQ